MASTPSNRLKLTPSNSPFLPRPSRSPIRSRHQSDSRLSLKRVVGTTCTSPTGFDTVHSSFAYIAGGAVVVVDVQGDQYSQRFYRARPTAVPVFAISPIPHAPSTPNSTPKANDSRNRVAPSVRDSPYGSTDWTDSPTSKTWTSRERIKAATCLSLSRDGRFLAVGETGYAPRVLVFSMQATSSDIPLVSISEHTFGVKAVAWSPDTKYLASLGAANDGFLYLWKIDPRTGAAKLYQQNRCTSYIRGMIWVGNNLITLGVRHIKVWKVDEEQSTSPVKKSFAGDGSFAPPQSQKPLAGRNILLGSLLEATFSCAVAVDDKRAIICSETGDVCLLDESSRQVKLHPACDVGFSISCISIRDQVAYVGSRDGRYAALSVDSILEGATDALIRESGSSTGVLAMGYLSQNLVTIDARRSIDIWSAAHKLGGSTSDPARITIPGHGDPILGIQPISRPNEFGAAFYTWSGSGQILLWDLEGRIKSTVDIPIEQFDTAQDSDPANQLLVVRATRRGKLFVAGDRLGVLRIIDSATKTCLMDTKAHLSDCQDISIYEDNSRILIASCGRDRTAQLFHRSSSGSLEHFQTLEFAAKVVQVTIPSDDKVLTCSLDRTLQVHDLVFKEGETDAVAAIPLRVISLKASPSSMVITPDEKSVFVSLLDRSVCSYEISTGRLSSSFKCTDEGGIESVVLDSLIYGETDPSEPNFLLGISNTDKSVRIYDAQAGSFLDREWGHTEAINGTTLLDEEDTGRKVVSVGSDGTIMIWALDLQDSPTGSRSRDPSPVKDSSSTSHRPPLRRVLSKAELAEFQRPSPIAGRRSPPRTVQRRVSKYGLSSATLTRTPTAPLLQSSPTTIIAEDTPSSRRASSGSPPSGGSPPSTINGKARIMRRPSLPALSSTHTTPTGPTAGAVRKKGSAASLRASYAFGSLGLATESACRTLRAYRRRLASSDPVAQDVLAELDVELRLTAAALGERAIQSRSKAVVGETVLSGLLDQYSERLVCMLDEKLRMRIRDEGDGKEGEGDEGSVEEEPEGGDGSKEGRRSADGSSSSETLAPGSASESRRSGG